MRRRVVPSDGALRVDDPVVLPAGGADGRLWSALLELAAAQPSGWTLVGGLMVMLHALEAGLATGRVTQDVDAVADSAAGPDRTRRGQGPLRPRG